jgi:hypothetical protein
MANALNTLEPEPSVTLIGSIRYILRAANRNVYRTAALNFDQVMPYRRRPGAVGMTAFSVLAI